MTNRILTSQIFERETGDGRDDNIIFNSTPFLEPMKETRPLFQSRQSELLIIFDGRQTQQPGVISTRGAYWGINRAVFF